MKESHPLIKILFFIETLTGGGAEKVLRNLVNHMDQTKFDITVQTVWPCNASEYLAPGIRYKSMYSAENRLNHIRYRAEAASGLAYLMHVRDNYDIECAYLEMGSTKIIASSTNKKAKKLAWVHCDLTKAVADPQAFADRASKWYERFDQVVCVSQGIRESFDKLFKDKFRTIVLKNVIDDKSIIYKASCQVNDLEKSTDPVVMAVGRLSTPKNYYRLLKAHERILRDGIPHQLWIIGEGPERTGLERFIKLHALQETVHMPGFKEDPYAYMSHADVIVCSSSYEGFSTAITEAVILGKPIVTTDCPGMREILGNSEYGLITANDDDSFYMGLRSMLENKEMQKEYIVKAEMRREAFSVVSLVNSVEEYLNAVKEGRV